MKKDDYIYMCRTFCDKCNNCEYIKYIEFLKVLGDKKADLQIPLNKRDVCKNCIYCDVDFHTGCNYPYIVW